MMAFLYSVIGFLIAIGILVAVHEFGHYWVARKLGVKVLRFSVGFGKPLLSKTAGADQTEYVLAAIPLGGYVKMLDENEGEVATHEQHRAFNRQPIWKRSLIVLAGPGINFLFAIIIFAILGMMGAEQLSARLGNIPQDSIAAKAGLLEGDQLLSVNGKDYQYYGQHDLYIFNQVLKGNDLQVQVKNTAQPDAPIRTVSLPVSNIPIYNISPSFVVNHLGLVPTFPEPTTVLQTVAPGSAADKAGLLPNDKIIAMNGQSIVTWQQLAEVITSSIDKPITIRVEREGALQNISVTPDTIEIAGKKIARLGISPKTKSYSSDMLVQVNRSLGQSFSAGVEQTWLLSSVSLRMFGKMITGKVSHKNVNGPITIAQVSGQAIQLGFDYYLQILAFISVSLGVMNLLPIPMLDGGHLLMYGIESVAGPKVAETIFAFGQRIGIFLLLCLMSLAFYNDIFRLLN